MRPSAAPPPRRDRQSVLAPVFGSEGGQGMPAALLKGRTAALLQQS